MATKKPLKVGKPVNILKRPSVHLSGRILAIRPTGRGDWYDVMVGGTKKEPVTASYRAGDIEVV